MANKLAWHKSSYSGSDGGNCVAVAVLWHKSSYSGGSGGNCVEVAVPWHKSSYSGSGGGDCVEVAETASAVYVRDTKDRGGPTLSVPGGQWSTFVTHIAERNR